VSDSSEEERTNRNSDRFRRLIMTNPVVAVLERREGGANLKARRRRGLSELPTDKVGSWKEAFYATPGLPSGVP